MKNRLIIIGAGGHGKVIADLAIKIGYSEIFFVDDNSLGKCLDFPIIGNCENLIELDNGQTDFVVAIGNNKTRKNIAEKYRVNYVKLIHPSAQIGLDVKIGVGTVVMAGVVINPASIIGKHCIINTDAIVEHDNIIENYVHISPKVALGGTVSISECTHVGIGATVKNNIQICDDCIIGAGAVVTKNIDESGIYVGVPAKEKNSIL